LAVGWVIGLFMLFFSFVKPIGPSPWKRYDAAKLPELPPVPRFDGSKLKESPQEVLAKILAARGDKSRPAPDPYRDHSLGKPSGMLWLIGGMAATIFVVLALIGAFR